MKKSDSIFVFAILIFLTGCTHQNQEKNEAYEIFDDRKVIDQEFPKAEDIIPKREKRYDCVIKGNISFDDQERIYHVPGQEYYEETKVNTDYGEEWFCTEAEARAAGWRKAKK